MRRLNIKQFRFNFQQKLALACLAIALLITVMLLGYYGKVHRDAWEQQIRYYQKNHEQVSALLNSVEQRVNSYYHQLAIRDDILSIIAKPDYGKADYYTLSEILKSFLNIINSDSQIASIYLYNRSSGKVLSTRYAFSNLDYFPDHVIINRFDSQAEPKYWFPARHERAGDQNSPVIISWAAGIPFGSRRGVIVFNLNRDRLLAGLGAKKNGLVILDRQDQVIGYQDRVLLGVYQRNRDKIRPDVPETSKVTRVHDAGHKYYCIVSNPPRANWRVVSVIPEALVREGITNNQGYLYLIILLFIAFTFGLAKVFQNTYSDSIRVYQEKLQTNLNSLIDSFNIGVLTGEYTRDEILAKSADLGIDLSGRRFLTIVYQINNYYSYLLENREYGQWVLAGKKIQNDIRECFFGYKASLASVELGKVAVILNLEDDAADREIPEAAARLIRESLERLAAEYRLTVRAAVSEVVDGVENIRIGYAQALKALNFKSFSGKNPVIYYKEVEVQTALDPNYPVAEIARLREYIKIGSLEKIERSIGQICDKLLAQPYIAVDLVNAVFANALYETIKVILEFGYPVKDIFGDEDLLITLYSSESLDEKRAFFLKVCGKLAEYRNRKEQNTQKMTVRRIIDYIEQNYDKTISLEIVADEVRMNPSYLSLFIKKELGINFIDYVVELRLKKAVRLLSDDGRTVKQIAEECGFDTVHSFIRNFKKHYQVTPSEFRGQMGRMRGVSS
jgi:AraC-like DNA-binding protein